MFVLNNNAKIIKQVTISMVFLMFLFIFSAQNVRAQNAEVFDMPNGISCELKKFGDKAFIILVDTATGEDLTVLYPWRNQWYKKHYQPGGARDEKSLPAVPVTEGIDVKNLQKCLEVIRIMSGENLPIKPIKEISALRHMPF
ncbi:MAG: hypothetical protein QG614_471 [Patescibacteria group bacterium]|nr:hypothetical protein [Patescibacteria group bacterium]